MAARCTNGVDEGEAGHFDRGEFSCLWNHPDCEPALEQSNAACADGIDNDQDGLLDCADSRCQQEGIVVCDGSSPITVAPGDYGTLSNAACADGMDNVRTTIAIVPTLAAAETLT